MSFVSIPCLAARSTPSGARTLDTLIKSQVHTYTHAIVCATVAHSAVMGCMSTWA